MNWLGLRDKITLERWMLHAIAVLSMAYGTWIGSQL